MNVFNVTVNQNNISNKPFEATPGLIDSYTGQINDKYDSKAESYWNQTSNEYPNVVEAYTTQMDPYGKSVDPYTKEIESYTKDPYRKDSYGKTLDTYAKEQVVDPHRKNSYSKPVDSYTRDPYRGDSFGKQDPYSKKALGNQVDPYANEDPYAKEDPYYDEDDPYSKSYSEEAYTNEEETYYYSKNTLETDNNKIEVEVTVEEKPNDKNGDTVLSRRG